MSLTHTFQIIASIMGQATEVITLSGTPSSYNSVVSEASGSEPTAGWSFRSDGTVFRTNISGSAYNVQFNAGTEWCNVTPSQIYYIRCTVQSGSLGGSSSNEDVWLNLATNRTFEVVDTTAGVSPAIVQMKIEIASDSGGSNILATGYYQAIANQEP